MVFALGQPAALAGLALALAVGLAVRVTVQSAMLRLLYATARPGGSLPTPHRDLSATGIIAAAFGGTGFGTDAPLLPGRPGAARAIAFYLAAPAASLSAGELALAAHTRMYDSRLAFGLYLPSDVLRGAPAAGHDGAGQLLFALGVGLICFAVIALTPIPPADGWSLISRLDHAGRLAGARRWLADRKLGAFLLMIALILPIGDMPPAHRLLDAVATPFIRLW